MTYEYTGIFKYLYDWQGLIAGVIALMAAYVAARPVWRQLTLSVRDTLIGRLAAMESRQETTRELMSSITDLVSRFRPCDNGQELDPDPYLAFDAQDTVNRVVATLKADQQSSLDGELIDNKRRAAISAVRALAGCLFNIHAPDTIDFGGPDEPAENERRDFEERADRSARELENRISAATKAAGDLEAAFLDGLEQLRQRIRRMDRQAGA